MHFFPPNCTSWIQPMDMGIIHAVKKRYKYLLLSAIINFHDLPSNAKELVMKNAPTRRGAKGVEHGAPANLMDAAIFIEQAWREVSSKSIQNCFYKSTIIPQLQKKEEMANDVDYGKIFTIFLFTSEKFVHSYNIFSDDIFVEDFIALLETSSVSDLLEDIDRAEVERVLHIDDKNSEDLKVAIMDDINRDVLEKI